MSTRRTSLALSTCLGLLLLLPACPSEEVECYADPDAGYDVYFNHELLTCTTYLPPVPDAVVGPEVTGDVAPVEEPTVGMACIEDDECQTGTCMTTDFLATFGLDTERMHVPGGMCTALFCTEDAECGPGGTCFDAEPAFGAAISLCLLGCQDAFGCRWKEEYWCLDPVAAGLDSGGEADAVIPPVCLPDSIIVAILCDDGHCDEPTPATGEGR